MTLLPIHIAAGLVALVAGSVALAVRKGGALHRKSGMIFVYAMLVMSGLGAVLAAVPHRRLNGALLTPQPTSVIGGALTFYLVITALLTVRNRPRWVDVCAMLYAAVLAVGCFALGPPGFFFGSVTVLSVIGDVRMMSRGVVGARRIARHLWRMCFAMFVATGSFFLGQAQLFPKPIRIVPLLAMPVLLVIVLMVYWLRRILKTPRLAQQTS